MRVILDICVDIGYTPQEILSYADKELCSPLYCAVTGGHVSVIHLCLEYVHFLALVVEIIMLVW